MNNKIAASIFYIIEFFRREKVKKYLQELEANAFLSRSELLHLQKKKLVKLMDYVINNNEFYIKKYKGYNVHEQFNRLPILTKAELRENYQKIVTKNEKKLDLVETSGSTGIPLKFYRDRIVFGYTLAALYRAHRWWGIDVGDKEAMLWGIPVNYFKRTKARVRDLLLNRFREDEYNINKETLEKFYNKILKKKPNYIFGYTSMIYEFSLFLKENNLDLHSSNLKAAICTAEKIQDFQREIIEYYLGCHVVSEYGSTETGIISYQCKEGKNHISDDCLYVEIVDENDIPMVGKSGRVLVTVLNSFSSPIIRYDLGDISSISGEKCSCGLPLTVLGDIEGRSSDVVIGPNGNVYHSIIFYYIMKELTEKFGGVKKFKVFQKSIESLDVHIIKDEKFASEAESFLRSQMHDKFGQNMHINIFYPEFIERNKSGKFRDFETEIDTSEVLLKIYKNKK